MAAAGTLAVTVSLAAQQSPKPTASALKPAASHAPATTTMLPAEQTAMVKQYCTTCHSERGKAGNLSLAGFDAAKIEQDGELTEKISQAASRICHDGSRRPERRD